METYIRKSALVFLSYSSVDKVIAGRLKSSLESFGINVFLAHEDIEPSAEWQKTILKNLRACNIFLPLLTESFPESDWTDQETGVAILLKKLIIPLKIDINPYGFMAKYQALKFDIDFFSESCSEIILVIRKRKEYREAVKDWAIRAFANSDSFNEASERSNLLLRFKQYDEVQLKEILKASIENNQIYDSFKARDNLKILISKFKDKIDKKLIWELESLIYPPDS